MHLNSSGRLWLVELIFFIIATVPTVYCLFKHGWKAVLGWGNLLAFYLLRIASAGINIHEENGGTVTTAESTVSRVGVSPLLRATLGILHES